MKITEPVDKSDVIKSDKSDVAASKGVIDDANTSSIDHDDVGGGKKRPSVEEAPVETEKPKKQFKRRNVALYSALGTDDV